MAFNMAQVVVGAPRQVVAQNVLHRNSCGASDFMRVMSYRITEHENLWHRKLVRRSASVVSSR